MRPDICRGASRIHATGKMTDAAEIFDLGSRTTELIAYKEAWEKTRNNFRCNREQ